jgi:hypothetical protein
MVEEPMNRIPPLGGGFVLSVASIAAISFSHRAKSRGLVVAAGAVVALGCDHAAAGEKISAKRTSRRVDCIRFLLSWRAHHNAMGIIPLDVANQILATFGINEPTPLYERRVTTGGFTFANFADVLFESRFVFVMDDELELDLICADVATALAELGAPVNVEVDEDEPTTGALLSPHAAVVLRFDRGAGDAYAAADAIVRGFQQAAGDAVEFRGRPGDEAGDCWIYAVLTPQEWRELDLLGGGVIRLYFAPLAA